MRGFTLVEVLVVVTVAGIAGFFLIQAFLQNTSFFYQQTGRVQEGLSLNNSSSFITEAIKSSTAVAKGYPSSEPYEYSSSASTLVLKIPSIDSSGDVISDQYDYLIFFKQPASPRLLVKKVIPISPSQRGGEEQVLLNNLSQLEFYYLDQNNNPTAPEDAKKVNFAVRVSTPIGINFQESSASGEVNLRND